MFLETCPTGKMSGEKQISMLSSLMLGVSRSYSIKDKAFEGRGSRRGRTKPVSS